ncbi:MAG: GNAT family N-acetyltransferase [Anaerolineales bacterium]
MTDISIREAWPSDSADVAQLITQLGYPSSENEIAQRMTVLSRLPEHATFVAELDGRVVGLVGAYLDYALEINGSYGRLMGLVVDESFRGRGIGKRLLEWIEGWLRNRGATRLTLTSGKQRIKAHKFYRDLGYEETGLRFAKKL